LITRRWFGWQTVFLTGFAILWDGFLFFWYSLVFLGKGVPSVMFWFPLLHVIAGVVITYLALAGWLNRTRVTINFEKITVISGPLPFFNNRVVDSSAIKQLYSKERITRSRNGTNCTYAVHAILSDQKNIKLADGLESSEQALFVEQEIEKYLGIKDVPVKGEL
jgi:hypothetical protein